MRYRGSITGPLILITLGSLFLAHTFSPGFDVVSAVSHYWPWLLIVWGAAGLLEVFLRSLRGGTVPVNGVSGGAWLFILLVIFAGYASWQWTNPRTWFHNASLGFLGDAHDFSFDLIRKPTGATPRIVIESFRGDAKVTGTDATEVTVTGHKTVRALDEKTAEQVNQSSSVQAIMEGNTVIIRCNQDQSNSRTQVSTDLEITVPKGAVLEAVGRYGDFEIGDIRGLDLSSDNAGVRVRDITGDVKIDTRQSDVVECSNIKGAVTLRGHGDDVTLKNVSGQVSVEGDYDGTISLRAISSQVRIESMHTQFDAQAIPGTLTLDRGTLDANNLVGPLKVTAESTDIDLNGFRAGLQLSVERGNVELKPGNLPLSDIKVNSQSGDVSLVLPANSNFDLTATTAHGEVKNDFGDPLTSASSDNGSTLSGKIGSGPQIAITADHGDISVSKNDRAENPPKTPPAVTAPPVSHSDSGSQI